MVIAPVLFLCSIAVGVVVPIDGNGTSASTASVALVPTPREITQWPGVVSLGAGWVVSSTRAPEDSGAVRLLIEEAADCGWPWRTAQAGGHVRTIELRAIAPSARDSTLFTEQGYRLSVRRAGVVIEGVTAQGRFYGVQTLRQLIRGHPDGAIPCVDILDYPALAWRGISDDISRGQMSSLEDFKAIIRQLAYYKVDLYQLYIEDVFHFENGPAAVQRSGALTRRELELLVEEGRRNHVVVSPIFETLTHQERLSSSTPPGSGDQEGPDLNSSEAGWGGIARATRDFFGRIASPNTVEVAPRTSFAADDPRALRYVQSLVDEIATVTRGPFFHVGGDEWQPVRPDGGATDAAGVIQMRSYGRYLGQISTHLQERFGCRAMLYGDVILEHPESAQDLSRNLIVVDWHYDPQDSFPSLRKLGDQGFRNRIVSPGLWTWSTFYPNYARAFPNVASAAKAAKREAVMGCITAAWGDGGAEKIRENNWAGYAYSAAACWETDAPPAEGFLRHFIVTQYGTDAPALARVEKLLGWQEFDGVAWVGRLYHRPAVVRARPLQWVERMKALQVDMRQVEQDLDGAEGNVRFNRDHLAVAGHAARRYAYIAARELLLDSIGRRLAGRTAADLSGAERQEILRGLDRLGLAARALQSEFAPLWLRHNRPEGLAENEERLANQAAMLGRIRREANRGSLRVDDRFSRLQALNPAN